MDAHKVRQGQAHQKGLDEALHHDPQGLIVAVEVAHHTEQDGGHDGLRREALQVRKALLHDLCVGREDTGQQVPPEQDEHEHDAPEGQTDADPRQYGLFGPRLLACAHVLGDEGGHGLHQRTGDEHGEVDDLAGDAVTGGGDQTQAVDEGAERQKGQLGQTLLQSQGQTDAEEQAALGVEAEVLPGDGKRQLLFGQQQDGEHHADRLRKHRCDGRAGGVHAEPGHQDEVAHDVDHAGHQHEEQRRPAVTKATEDGGEQVIGHDEEDTAAADAHIAGGQADGLLRCLHQHGDGTGKAHQQDKHPHREDGEHNGGSA